MAYNPNNPNGQATSANSAPVVVASDQTAVPVSASSLPLPTGAATSAKQAALGTAGSASSDVLSVQGIASMTPLKVDGSAVTQPVSAVSLPLPPSAATSTKQSDGTQKTQAVDASGHVLDVPVEGATFADTLRGLLLHGREAGTGAAAIIHSLVTTAGGLLKVDISGTAANATPLKVDGSAVTQPVSLATNTPTLAAGTNTIGDVNLTVAARGGYSVSSQTALTTAATVSAAAGKFGGVMFMNLNSAPAYIQVFDTTGAVTLGTTTPTFVIPLPANATAANGVAAVHGFSVGIAITNGIKVAATTTATGATVVGTGLVGFVMYK